MKSLPLSITKVCEESHIPMIHGVFGDPGVDAAFQVMGVARVLYQHVEPERITGQVVIYRIVVPQEGGPAAPSGPSADFGSLANRQIIDLVFEIGADGNVYPGTPLAEEVAELARRAVVYRYESGSEEFLAGTQRKNVIRLDSTARSQFSVPTLSSLREALQHYARDNVLESTCYIFRRAWRDPRRLFLRAKPEAVIRDSLTQFLRNRLGGDHDVWPEQNTDESHPVDIQVMPRLTNNRLMLIEIKWLGMSTADDGHITARHGNPRAQEGAEQLSGYLEEKRRSAPTHVVHGYYVIIDARRLNLAEGVTEVCIADGMHFEDKELTFDPAPHETRQDFDPPYRMFARPECAG